MTSFLFLLAAPALADSTDRQADRDAREWSDYVVDQIDGYGTAVQEMQRAADKDRQLMASRCLAPKTGELERLAKQADQARDRYEAGLKDDSDYAQFTATEDLNALLSRAELQYNQAAGCGMPLVPIDEGMQFNGSVYNLVVRASDGMSVRGVYFAPGIDLQAGWAGNALLADSDPASSLWFAVTPRLDASASWRSWSVNMKADTRLSKWTAASERDEFGTWDAFGGLAWNWGDFAVSGSGYSQRQVAQLTPWPGMTAPYASTSNTLVLDMRGDVRGRLGLAAWGALNQNTVQSGDVDRVREGLPVTAELVIGGYQGLVLQGHYETFGWKSQDGLDLQPMLSGQSYSAQAGLRRYGSGYLSALYGVAWLDDGSGPERGWVGRTDLNFDVRGVTVGGFHERTFSDHWLAPSATLHTAGGSFSTWLRSVEVHGSGAWGVERPGDLALRSLDFQGGVRYELPLNTAIDLSGGWEQRTAIEGTDPALGYNNPKVMLTLEVF
jgi:hypothetical protein